MLDASGSMGGTREAMARAAAKLVVDTLMSVDYVTVVRFSSSASPYSSTLVQATPANKRALKDWIEFNIDAAGSTNFRDAFRETWQVIDATTTSSGCNRVVLFMSDGVPNTWPNTWSDSDYNSLAAKSASYDPPVHVLTYALGSGADSSILKNIACQNSGVFYKTDDNGDLASTMAGYFKILTPMLKPCQTRWVEYEDYYTGVTLLGACLASYQKLGATTSCNDGLNGLGDDGDGRVASLIGVGCVDMNLIEIGRAHV